MDEFVAVKLPSGAHGDEIAQIMTRRLNPCHVSSDITGLTGFMNSVQDPPAIRANQGFTPESTGTPAPLKYGGVQRLTAGHDLFPQSQSIATIPPINQGSSFLRKNAPIVGGSNANFPYSVKKQTLSDLNAVDVLLRTATGSSRIRSSSGDQAMESVVKEEEKNSMNPQWNHPRFNLGTSAEALMKEEVVEDGRQNSGAIEGLVKEEDVNIDFLDSGDHGDVGEKKAEETYQAAAAVDHLPPPARRYLCTICNIRFSAYSQFVYHRRAIHFQCDECQLRFPSRAALTDHKRLHITCDVCGKQFNHRCDLKRHKMIHTGERPYECEVCLKRFAEKSKLKIHWNTHTGQRPYICPECFVRYSDPSALRNHRRRVHGA